MPAIVASEIIAYPGINAQMGDTNGGRMNHLITLPSNVLGVFPDITEGNRLDGRVGANALSQKIFYCVRNAENKTYVNALCFIPNPFTATGHFYELTQSSHAGVWADAKSARRYSTGTLNAAPTFNSVANETTLAVSTAGQSFGHFVVGDTIAIFNQSNPADPTGTLEFLPLKAISYSGSIATMVLNGGLRYSYTPSRISGGITIQTRVASAISFGDVKCGFTTSSNSSALGTINASLIEARNMGAKHQTITISFQNANEFTGVSNLADIGSSMVSGTRASRWTPLDSAGQPMLSIPSSAWGGTWSAGDSVQIHCTPPAMPLFLTVQVQAGAPPFESQRIEVWYSGNSSSVSVGG